MTEEEARLALLQTELNAIQSAIRNFDTISLQVKGWCVSAALAIGGFAAAYRKPDLVLVGIGAVVGFYLVNCHFNMNQRNIMSRNLEIDAGLRTAGIMETLKGGGSLEITGAAIPMNRLPADTPLTVRVRERLPHFYFEATRVGALSLYAFISVCLLVEIVLLLF